MSRILGQGMYAEKVIFQLKSQLFRADKVAFELKSNLFSIHIFYWNSESSGLKVLSCEMTHLLSVHTLSMNSDHDVMSRWTCFYDH
jgi:hypothetical protein